MKKRSLTKIFMMMFFILCGTFIVANCKPMVAQAASSTTMKNAYKKYLKKNKKNIEAYAYANIGPSGKPALLISDGESNSGKYPTYSRCKIYYYVNGKVKKVGVSIGARSLSIYQKDGKKYLWNGTSSNKEFIYIKNNKAYVKWYCNTKTSTSKVHKKTATYNGMKYTIYYMGYAKYEKALKNYKEVKVIKFKKV